MGISKYTYIYLAVPCSKNEFMDEFLSINKFCQKDHEITQPAMEYCYKCGSKLSFRKITEPNEKFSTYCTENKLVYNNDPWYEQRKNESNSLAPSVIILENNTENYGFGFQLFKSIKPFGEGASSIKFYETEKLKQIIIDTAILLGLKNKEPELFLDSFYL